MEFLGKTAILSGGASGMGLLFAQNWAKLGGNVVMRDINETSLMEKAEAINAEGGGRALGVVCDVRDYQQVEYACQTAYNTFGSLDVVCNFAGGPRCGCWGFGGSMQNFRMFPLRSTTGASMSI